MTTSPSHTHIPALDGLRGFAVLIVFIYHYGYAGGAQTSNPFLRLIGTCNTAGWCGVPLFFLLSGFLISGILWDDRDHPNWWRRFYLRRTLRIFPLYYASLILVLLSAFFCTMAELRSPTSGSTRCTCKISPSCRCGPCSAGLLCCSTTSGALLSRSSSTSCGRSCCFVRAPLRRPEISVLRSFCYPPSSESQPGSYSPRHWATADHCPPVPVNSPSAHGSLSATANQGHGVACSASPLLSSTPPSSALFA